METYHGTVPLPTKTDAVREPQLVQHVAPLGATASLNPCIPSLVFYSPHICCVSIVICEQAGLRPGSTHSVAWVVWNKPPISPHRCPQTKPRATRPGMCSFP